MKPHVIAGIFARGGSKGVPRKNIRLLAGKPLIAYAIETARASELIDRVIVSTDDAEIANVALQYGAEVPFMRPSELAQDDSPEWSAWQHAIRMLEGAEGRLRLDAFVCVPPTSPLRSVEDVDACVRMLLAGDTDMVITVRPAERSPYFNMVVLDDLSYARLVIQPQQATFRRQDVPVVYDMTTVAYAARPEFVLGANSMFQGKVKAVVVPSDRALDIDTELDFRIAEFLLGRSD
jgi:N-acylneuraminate cytidylyltransferase